MLLKKKVKAGILLYALLMLAVFSLLLQFYLHRQEAESRLVQVARQETTAYIMAQMVLDKVEQDLQVEKIVAGAAVSEKEANLTTGSKQKEDGGRVSFREGQARYQLKGDQLLVAVELTSDGLYTYQFPVKIIFEEAG
ncbi:competence protein ComGG [Streptococcus suis]|uniref:competence type IV pilus minor pilin ComGG n=1 Tax=Streptococcus suis TaxID=1307 RepID=UPI0004066BD0|nr:competence type IV pilus minor pilin ComGG [Streptococcus suis]MBL6504805.1 competence protein ComGG [Streptococcus suis]MBM0242080.1 competence protein ComGG [Streptococcus suis]MBM7205493.1 competence protein ComGG [Streptococcus suis]MBM7282527.1 competence protein ComGG [Streptococcus suis]MBO4116451.1 competence protein ComGG [Streptococcus suis]